MKKFNLVIISVIILSSSSIALADEASRSASSENSAKIIDSSTENQVTSDDNTSSDDTKEIGSTPQTSSSVSKTTEPSINESEQPDSTTAAPNLESSLTMRALPRQVVTTVAMYRLYNPNNKEHFYIHQVLTKQRLCYKSVGENSKVSAGMHPIQDNLFIDFIILY